ncbi:MAG: glycosyltransferase [Alphaproteobacteria bacterium]|nr:glycosyltransferase [Alphaproteobacteria bacterium]
MRLQSRFAGELTTNAAAAGCGALTADDDGKASGEKDMARAVTVIIVNFNAGARLARVIAHLRAQVFQDFDVIVFDNASSDGSADGLEAGALDLRVIKSAENLGFAAGNNRAAREAAGEWIAFLNPDAYPEPGWLAALMNAAARHPGVDAFGSLQIDAGDPARLDGAGDAYHVFGLPWRGGFGWPAALAPEEGECFAPCAAAALYRRATFDALGGFDESFFCYGEDVDLGFRLRLAGGRAVEVPGARVAHEGSGVTGRRSEFTTYHGHRNRIWTYFKNMPGAILWPMLPFHLLTDVYLLLRLSAIGLGGAYLKAMRDAWKDRARIFAERRRIQASRRVSFADLARALSWSPFAVMQRAPVIRAVKPAPAAQMEARV